MSLELPNTSVRMLRAEPSREVQTPEKSPSNAVQSSDGRRVSLADLDIDAAICEAMRVAGLTHTDVCTYMDLDMSLWARQRKGLDAHVSLQRVKLLPDTFWLALLVIIGRRLGVVVAHPDLAMVAIGRVADALVELVQFVEQEQTLRRSA